VKTLVQAPPAPQAFEVNGNELVRGEKGEGKRWARERIKTDVSRVERRGGEKDLASASNNRILDY